MATAHYNFTEIADADAIDVVGDLNKDLGEIDAALYTVDKKADSAVSTANAAKETADTAKVSADAAKASADETAEAALASISGAFDTSSRVLDLRAFNKDGNEKSAVSLTIPGGGSADINVISPQTVDHAATASGGTYNLALGEAAEASGEDSSGYGGAFAVGANASATGPRALALGDAAGASGDSAVALGMNAHAEGLRAFALGYAASAAATDSLALGSQSKATAENAVSLGYPASGSVPELTRRIMHVTAPTDDTDAANKAYVVSLITALCEKNGLTAPSFD